MQLFANGGVDGFDGFVPGVVCNVIADGQPCFFLHYHEVPGNISVNWFYFEVKVGIVIFSYFFMKENVGRFVVTIFGHHVFVVASACITGKQTGVRKFINVLLDVVSKVGTQESGVAIGDYEPVVGRRDTLKFTVIGIEKAFIEVVRGWRSKASDSKLFKRM